MESRICDQRQRSSPGEDEDCGGEEKRPGLAAGSCIAAINLINAYTGRLKLGSVEAGANLYMDICVRVPETVLQQM